MLGLGLEAASGLALHPSFCDALSPQESWCQRGRVRQEEGQWGLMAVKGNTLPAHDPVRLHADQAMGTFSMMSSGSPYLHVHSVHLNTDLGGFGPSTPHAPFYFLVSAILGDFLSPPGLCLLLCVLRTLSNLTKFPGPQRQSWDYVGSTPPAFALSVATVLTPCSSSCTRRVITQRQNSH